MWWPLINNRRVVALLAVFWLLRPAQAHAQIAFDTAPAVTTHAADIANYTVDSASFTVASSGSLIVAGVCLFDPGAGNPLMTAAALDGTGAAFSETHAHIQISPDGDHNVYQWYLANVSSGSHTVRFSVNQLGNFEGIIFVFNGTATASPLDGTGATATNTSSTPASGNIAGQAQADSLVVAAVGSVSTANPATVTAGTNYTIPSNGSQLNGSVLRPVCGQEYRLNPGSSTNNPGFTLEGSLNWAEIAAAFKIASGGAAATPRGTLIGVLP